MLTYKSIHKDRGGSCKGSSEAEYFALSAAIPQFLLKPQFLKQSSILKNNLNFVATVTGYANFGGLTLKIISLEAPSPHATFESSRPNSNKSSKFDPKSDLLDMVHSLANSNKPTGRMDGVINVSYQEYRVLSIDSGFEHVKTIYLKMIFIEIISFYHKMVAMATRGQI